MGYLIAYCDTEEYTDISNDQYRKFDKSAHNKINDLVYKNIPELSRFQSEISEKPLKFNTNTRVAIEIAHFKDSDRFDSWFRPDYESRYYYLTNWPTSIEELFNIRKHCQNVLENFSFSFDFEGKNDEESYIKETKRMIDAVDLIEKLFTRKTSTGKIEAKRGWEFAYREHESIDDSIMD